MNDNLDKIGLALSGGGVRAAAFHAGLLLYLAERDLLEKVAHISSVSGGTLFTGLVFHASSYVWPNSFAYKDNIFHSIKRTLTEHSLQKDAFFKLFIPKNWKLLLRRAEILSQSIEALWGINQPLSSLPVKPIWSINGTTAETGHRFRFRDRRFGDYELGYANAQDFSLASALTVSAAFPGGIGPLSINVSNYSWQKREEWEEEIEKDYEPPYSTIHLYDGGIYDNLGIEPFFDIGKQEIKKSAKINYIIVSDASAPYTRTSIPGALNPCRFKKLFDLTSDQTRALRVRSLVNYLMSPPHRALYCQLGVNPTVLPKIYHKLQTENAEKIYQEKWLTGQEIEKAKNFATSLNKLSQSEFDLLARHGYEAAKANFLLFE